MLKFIGKQILTGLVAILPVFLTIYLVYWLATMVETLLGNLIRQWLPDNLYWPGMGLLAGLVVLFIIGLLTHAYVVQVFISRSEQLLYNTPVIKSIYSAFRDFLDYFSPSRKKDFDQVVAVTLGDGNMQMVGFVTQSNPDNLPESLRSPDHVLVYLPLSYMIGGFAVLVPRNAVRPVDMTMEEAMRFTLTAGVTGPNVRPGGDEKT